jgi:hypothetical protein
MGIEFSKLTQLAAQNQDTFLFQRLTQPYSIYVTENSRISKSMNVQIFIPHSPNKLMNCPVFL